MTRDSEATGVWQADPPGRVQSGLAFRIIGFFATIIVGAIVFALLNPAVGLISDITIDIVGSGVTQTSLNRTTKIWGHILFYTLFLAVIMLVSAAVHEGQGGL